jgi:outer membrane autotransporter protein
MARKFVVRRALSRASLLAGTTLGAVGLSSVPGIADTLQFQGYQFTSQSWFTPGNWLGLANGDGFFTTAIPGAATDAIIPGPLGCLSGTMCVAVVDKPNAVANTVTINSATLQISSGGTLAVNGPITFDAGSQISILGGGSLTASVVGNGGFTNGGTWNAFGASSVGSLANSGVINMQNGVTSDVVTVRGNYVGSPGSAILYDFATSNSTADRLVVNGSASGTTAVSVRNLTPGSPFTTSPALIQVNGAQNATFNLVGATNFGPVSVLLLPTGGGSIGLASVPNSTGLSGSVASLALQSIGFVSSDVVLDHMEDVRNETKLPPTAYAAEAIPYAPKRNPTDAFAAFKAPPPVVGPTVRPAVWAKAFGDFENRDGSGTFTFGGTNFSQDLSFRQRTGGVTTGADALIKGLSSADDALLVGALLGYLNSHVELKTAPVTQNYDGGSIGAYATYLRGNWFTDLLFKADILNLNINAPSNFTQSTGVVNYDLAGNIGYRFDLPSKYYIEPTAGFQYVRTVYDNQTALTATTIALNNGEATLARIGARAGTEYITNGIRIEPSLTGYVYSVLSATNSALFLNGGGISLPSDQGKVRGEIQASVNFFNLKNGVSGFIRSDTRFGEGLIGETLRAGIRYQM